jgi:uncharacterized membrane protein
MQKNRLEAFSDGVLAIIITIMVLEMKVPHGADLASLKALAPKFLSYILSFVYIGIYWSNHHHMMHAVEHIDGKSLWANMHLLFWLSLIPFGSGWMGENNFAQLPVIGYGILLFMSAIAYYILAHSLASLHQKNSTLVKALGEDKKGKISVILYAAAVGIAFLNAWISLAMYAVVALMWFIPDSRIEKKIVEQEMKHKGEDKSNQS